MLPSTFDFFRYWDWVIHAVPPPELISLPTLTITGPDGHDLTVNNPFLSYTFPNATNTLLSANWTGFPATIRYPNSSDPLGDLTKNLQALQVQVGRFAIGPWL